MMRWFVPFLGLWVLVAACNSTGGTNSGSSSATMVAPTTSTGAVAAGSATPAAGISGAAAGGVTRTGTATASAPASVASSGRGQGAQEACTIVTKAEVERATGLSFEDGVFNPGGLNGTCIYKQQRTAQSDLPDSTIYVQPFSIRSVFDEMRAAAQSPTDVPGLGDRAFVSGGSSGGLVVVMKGNRGFSITWDHVTLAPNPSLAARNEKLVELARAGVSRF